MAMRMAVMALRNAAEARMNTRKAMRLIHSIRSRKVMAKSVGRTRKFVNCFLTARCGSEDVGGGVAEGKMAASRTLQGEEDALMFERACGTAVPRRAYFFRVGAEYSGSFSLLVSAR